MGLSTLIASIRLSQHNHKEWARTTHLGTLIFWMSTIKLSRTTCSRLGPHRDSIKCYNFDEVGIGFGNFFLWVVKIRFYVPWFRGLSFHVGHLPTKL